MAHQAIVAIIYLWLLPVQSRKIENERRLTRFTYRFAAVLSSPCDTGRRNCISIESAIITIRIGLMNRTKIVSLLAFALLFLTIRPVFAGPATYSIDPQLSKLEIQV